MKPKRYLVFAGLQYYPCGGWVDLKASFDVLSEAFASAAEHLEDTPYSWAEVIDLETGSPVKIEGWATSWDKNRAKG